MINLPRLLQKLQHRLGACIVRCWPGKGPVGQRELRTAVAVLLNMNVCTSQSGELLPDCIGRDL